MWYLATQYFWWLLAALLLGLVIGWLTCSREPSRWWTGWVPFGVIAWIIGAFLTWFRFVNGVPALWIETALLFSATWFAGCCLGCWLKGLFGVEEPRPVVAAAPVAAAVAVAAAVPKPAPVVAPPPPPPPAPPVVKAPPPPPPAPVPAAMPKIEGEDLIAGKRPASLAAPRGGVPDDLKLIKGIGKQNEGRLHGLGIWHFDQIAAWTKDNALWAGSYLAFPGRIEREEWVKQARILASGKATEFSKRAKWGLVATSKDDGSLGQGNVANVAKVTRTSTKGKAPTTAPKPKGKK